MGTKKKILQAIHFAFFFTNWPCRANSGALVDHDSLCSSATYHYSPHQGTVIIIQLNVITVIHVVNGESSIFHKKGGGLTGRSSHASVIPYIIIIFFPRKGSPSGSYGSPQTHSKLNKS